MLNDHGLQRGWKVVRKKIYGFTSKGKFHMKHFLYKIGTTWWTIEKTDLRSKIRKMVGI